MGRRRAEATQETGRHPGSALLGNFVLPAVAFVLEVAMVASFAYWGFRRESPWNMILGIGVPAVVVVLWGIFMAPRSGQRLKEPALGLVALVMFLAAGGALFDTGATVLGIAMAIIGALWFLASRSLGRGKD